LRLDHDQSRILIADCDGNLHVFPVLTSVLKTMREQGLLQESAEDIRHSKLQGVTLKSTEKGNARADMIRRIGIVEHR
jgi:hypothetical protein